MVLAIEPELPQVAADEDVLSRIIQNLVVNAVEHTPMDGRLTFRGFLGKEMLTVSLSDQGPGVDPAYREVIFEKFSRNPGPARTQPVHGPGAELLQAGGGGPRGPDLGPGRPRQGG